MLSAIVRFFAGVPTNVSQAIAPLIKAQNDLQKVIELRGDERDYKTDQITVLERDISEATSEINLAVRVKASLEGLLS